MTGAVKPIVGIVMGSNSDWEVMKNAAEMLKASTFRSKPAS